MTLNLMAWFSYGYPTFYAGILLDNPAGENTNFIKFERQKRRAVVERLTLHGSHGGFMRREPVKGPAEISLCPSLVVDLTHSWH